MSRAPAKPGARQLLVETAERLRNSAGDLMALASTRRLAGPHSWSNRYRLERFGAIVQLRRPRALVFVDRQFARRLGLEGGQRWSDTAGAGALGDVPLSAPLEAHLQLTNRCEAGCSGCYTAASRAGSADELGPERWKQAIDELARMGVFHLALGGGESAALPWLGEVAAHARARGLVPNLTTSGLDGLDQLLPIAHTFGQINVSMDGVGDDYRHVRGHDGFARADMAVVRLRRIKKEIGINTVLTRPTFDRLEAIFAYARSRRLSEVELLRFKPAGRGRARFDELSCTDAQHRRLLPVVRSLLARHRIRVRVDCSFVPMIAHHHPAPELLESLAVYGCTGGDFLIGASATGTVAACSFAAPERGNTQVGDLRARWTEEGAFASFRDWRDAREPCRSCRYLALCRGGCRIVSQHVLGDISAPDPQCPRVVDYLGSFDRGGARAGSHRSATSRLTVLV